MTMFVYALVVGYIVLGLLLLNLCFYSRWPYGVKIVMTVMVASFYYVSYISYLGIQGWPTASVLPQQTLVLASYVIEPEPETGSDGMIYVWVDDVSSGEPLGTPRAYELPYNAELHERFLEARQRSGNGLFQIMRQSDEVEKDSPFSPLSRLIGGQKSQKLDIMDLPDPALPGK